MTGGKPCKNAGTDSNHLARPAPYPGPRCATCQRDRKHEVSERRHANHIERNFDITAADYASMYVAQGGKCFVPTCRSTGKVKRLAVHHDHKLAAMHSHPIDQGCRLCVVGLACGPCNKDVLGRLGDLPETYRALANLLENPPAQLVFGNGGTVPDEGFQTYIGGPE